MFFRKKEYKLKKNDKVYPGINFLINPFTKKIKITSKQGDWVDYKVLTSEGCWNYEFSDTIPMLFDSIHEAKLYAERLVWMPFFIAINYDDYIEKVCKQIESNTPQKNNDEN